MLSTKRKKTSGLNRLLIYVIITGSPHRIRLIAQHLIIRASQESFMLKIINISPISSAIFRTLHIPQRLRSTVKKDKVIIVIISYTQQIFRSLNSINTISIRISCIKISKYIILPKTGGIRNGRCHTSYHFSAEHVRNRTNPLSAHSLLSILRIYRITGLVIQE